MNIGGAEVKIPLIFKLNWMEFSGQRQAVAALAPAVEPQYPFSSRLDVLQSGSRYLVKEKKHLPMRGFEPVFVLRAAKSLSGPEYARDIRATGGCTNL